MTPELWAVSGGSGYIGRHLTRTLMRAGKDVRILALPGEQVDAGVEAIRGGLDDARLLQRLVEGAGVVVHLAAYVHRAVRGAEAREECFRTNVEGTRHLAEAVAAVVPQAMFLNVSSASVYGPSDDLLTERSVCHPATVYGLSKLQAENAVGDVRARFGIRAVSIRPAMVFGPGAPGNMGRLIAMVRRGLVIDIGGSGSRKSILPVETMVSALMAIASRPELADGEVFNVTGGPPMSMSEITAEIARALEAKPRVVTLPGPPLLALARLGDFCLKPARGRIPALTQMIESYTSSSMLDDLKFRNLFGFQTAVSIETALHAVARHRAEPRQKRRQ